MDVQGSNGYKSLLETYKSYRPQRTSSVDDTTTNQTLTATVSTTEKSPNNAVTVSTTSHLAPETAKAAIQAGQEIDEKSNAGLSGPEKSHLDEIANNAEYAKKMSEAIGTGPDLIRIHESQMPKNGGDPAYAKSFYQKIDALQLKASEVSERRTKFYEAQVAQNVPPAQIYANLMEFNANLSQDYWNSMNIGYEKSSRTTASFQAEHDYLQDLINQNNAAATSVKTKDLSKAAG